MKSWVNDIVAGLNRSHSCGRKSHTDILDNVSGRKRKISHLLGVDLLGLRYDGDVSIVDSGIEKSEETKCKSCAHLCVLVLGIDEVYLVVS